MMCLNYVNLEKTKQQHYKKKLTDAYKWLEF